VGDAPPTLKARGDDEPALNRIVRQPFERHLEADLGERAASDAVAVVDRSAGFGHYDPEGSGVGEPAVS
jgi:hypothetical protein